MLGLVLETVQVNDLWIQDRNCCPCAFLCEIDRRGAGFITRQHAGLPFEPVNVRAPWAASRPATWPSSECKWGCPRGRSPVAADPGEI